MVVARSCPNSVSEVMKSIPAYSHAALNPTTGEMQFASGFLASNRGQKMCEVLFSMSSRARDVLAGNTEGMAFSCSCRKYEYKFESVWTKDTLLIYLRDRP